jgi:hypothetical protein
MAIGDIDRRVANVRLVGDGDKPYGNRIVARLLVGDGLEQPVPPVVGKFTSNAFVSDVDNSDSLLMDQLSASNDKSSQLWEICIAV